MIDAKRLFVISILIVTITVLIPSQYFTRALQGIGFSSTSASVLFRQLTKSNGNRSYSSNNIKKPVVEKRFTEKFNMTKKAPVYFLSHGGPTFLYNDDFGGNLGCYRTVRSIGQHVKDVVKPKFILCISGHWEASTQNQFEIGVPDESTMSGVDKHEDEPLFQSSLKSNTDDHFKKLEAGEHSLIYDFYGFPDNLYRERFHAKGSVEIAEQIQKELTSHGLNSIITKRGLDHGVWVPLKVAFGTFIKTGSSDEEIVSQDSKHWDAPCPIVQISLARRSDDFDLHYKLGKALQKFRSEGGLIVTSGSSVHNLRDLGVAMARGGQALPYVDRFNAKLKEILDKKVAGESALAQFNLLKKEKSLLYKAHPTLDHLMPIVAGLGASEGETGQQLYTDSSLSLGWSVFKWGQH